MNHSTTSSIYLALKRYQKAYSKVKKNKDERDRISFQIAECYRMMNNTKRAEVAYKRLLTSKYIASSRKFLYYADMLKANGNYDEAIKQYKAYKETVPSDPRGESGHRILNQAKEWIENPSKYDVVLEKKINTRDDEFAPAYADKNFASIIFTSDRECFNRQGYRQLDRAGVLRYLFLQEKTRKENGARPFWLTRQT